LHDHRRRIPGIDVVRRHEQHHLEKAEVEVEAAQLAEKRPEIAWGVTRAIERRVPAWIDIEMGLGEFGTCLHPSSDDLNPLPSRRLEGITSFHLSPLGRLRFGEPDLMEN